MTNFQTILESAPLPDLRLRRRAAQLVQSMVRGQSANSLGCLSPANATRESFTRGAYRFFDNDDVTRTALHTPKQVALRELISPSETVTVAHDLSVLNYSGHNRKEDLIHVGNDRTWGYELFQSLVIKAGVSVGAAVTELRCDQGILSWYIPGISLPGIERLRPSSKKGGELKFCRSVPLVVGKGCGV